MEISKEVKEFTALVVSSFIIGFVFTFSDWSINNFIIATVLSLFTLMVHRIVEGWVAENYGIEIKYELSAPLIVFSLMIAFISNGSLCLLLAGTFSLISEKSRRLAYKYREPPLFEKGKISFISLMLHLIIALFSKLFYPSPFFLNLSLLNSYFALSNLLPVPGIDGSNLIMWSWISWLASVGISLVFILLPTLGFTLSLLLFIGVSALTFVVGQKYR